MTQVIRMALPEGLDFHAIANHLRAAGIALPQGGDLWTIERPFDMDFDLEILKLAPVDVGTYVERGAVQLGVMSTDLLHESDVEVWRPFTFNFGTYPIIFGTRHGTTLASLNARPQIRLATPIPRFTREWFATRGFTTEILHVKDSAEKAVLLGLADGFVDRLVHPERLIAEGFRAVERVGTTHLKLIVNNATNSPRRKFISTLMEALENHQPPSPNRVAIPFDEDDD